MDPRSEWALGEFRETPIELRLLDHRGASKANPAEGEREGGGNRAQAASTASRGVVGGAARRIAYQGERLSGLLVVKFDAGSGERFSAQGISRRRVCLVVSCLVPGSAVAV